MHLYGFYYQKTKGLNSQTFYNLLNLAFRSLLEPKFLFKDMEDC